MLPAASRRRLHFGEDTIELWSAQDALVLKAAAIVLTRHLKPRNLIDRVLHLRYIPDTGPLNK